MKQKYFGIVLILMCNLFFSSCFEKSEESLTSFDIEIFKETPAWELVKAVKKNKARKIVSLINQNKQGIVNYQEQRYGQTPLLMAVQHGKYKSAEVLLKNGADPDQEDFDGITPLTTTCNRIFDNYFNLDETRFIELLLDHGADINKHRHSKRMAKYQPEDNGFSPLMYAARESYVKTKLLVERGADLSYRNELGNSAAIVSLSNGVDKLDPNIPYFLIVDRKADIAQTYFAVLGGFEDKLEMYPVSKLYDWFFDFNSEKFKLKMEIVKEFQRQGVDYDEMKKTDPNTKKYEIMREYPDNWQDVFDKY